jgi:hypothetical protein
MRTFTIDNDNQITVYDTPEEATAASTVPFDSFASEEALAALAGGWPAARLVAIWNSLPGVTRVKKFENHKTALRRIWARIQRLGEPAVAKGDQGQSAKAEQPEATDAKNGAGLPKRVYIPGHGWASTVKAAPRTKKETKKAAGKGNKKGDRKAPKKGTRTEAPTAPRIGTKMAQVIAMLQRKNGATLNEIADKMGWQKHTVRGFMAGAMKKAGYMVESFKPEGEERTYRISS